VRVSGVTFNSRRSGTISVASCRSPNAHSSPNNLLRRLFNVLSGWSLQCVAGSRGRDAGPPGHLQPTAITLSNGVRNADGRDGQSSAVERAWYPRVECLLPHWRSIE
jgi:hypothetical protein